ncbi:MAG TPA: hypothetical protein DCE44_13405 [Verrucomicrobiales bacterium]|nr:hypothetical protein [Verrucomicrobiales bacterium]
MSQVRDSLAEKLTTKVGGKKRALQPVDLTNALAAVARISQPVELDLSGEHNVFNPVRWIRGSDGVPKPDPRQDLSTTLKLLKTGGLNLTITYLGPTGTGDPYRYQFRITREFEKKRNDRNTITVSLNEGAQNDWFRLTEVHGPKDSAGEVVIRLREGGESVTLAKEKPFSKVMGYQADLRFESREFAARRVDDTLNLMGASYKIVAIGKDEIVVSAPNGTRTTVKLASNP